MLWYNLVVSLSLSRSVELTEEAPSTDKKLASGRATRDTRYARTAGTVFTIMLLYLLPVTFCIDALLIRDGGYTMS